MLVLLVLNRNLLFELDRFLDIVDLNVLRIGGRNNVRVREYGYFWGGGVRFGVVEYNLYVIDFVLRA